MASTVNGLASPSRAADNMTASTSDAPVASTRPLELADDNDLDPAAFLRSVRELSAKREREDNERFRKLEEEIEKGRQERLARRAEYARSISPEKRETVVQPPARSSGAPPSRPASVVATTTTITRPSINPPAPSISTPSKSTSSSTGTTIQSSPSGVEEVPEFAGFGSAQKSASPMLSQSLPAPAVTNPSLPPTIKPSPSAAMPGRSGSLRWQQRPANRVAGARPLSMVAVENSHAGRLPDGSQADSKSEELSRADIAQSLASRDPAWFRQTPDRGIGNAAFRKTMGDTDGDTPRVSRQGLVGLSPKASPALSESSRPVLAMSAATSISISESAAQPTTATAESKPPHSPGKDMGGFVQSAMMKRNDSISKRSAPAHMPPLDRAANLRAGFGGLQGSHSMPKLEQPGAPDSLVRAASSAGIVADVAKSSHTRARSITSAYTVNEQEKVSSTPSSPSKRWSPNKSSWIEKALVAKPDSRPASPTKNSQPSWMSDLAKANAAKAGADGHTSTATSAPISQEPSVYTTAQPTQPAQNKGSVVDTIATSTNSNYKPAIGPKPQPSPKPQQLDFRSTLKSRAATAPTPQEQPEFLSRFGALRKTTTEKYTAPDTLKDNILRGKAGLSISSGPQKSEQRDEFKDSIIAKKEQWMQDKHDGVVTSHKTTAPTTPTKPEALMKREAMSRNTTIRAPSPEKDKQTTPEALKRHHTIRSKPAVAIPTAETSVSKFNSTEDVTAGPTMATNFNSQLAGLLARGPGPSSAAPSTRPAIVSAAADVMKPELSRGAEDPLQDMRKGRAKGPKRRKAGTTTTTTTSADETSHEEGAVSTPAMSTAAMSSTAARRSTASPRSSASTKPTLSTKPAAMKDHTPLGWDEETATRGPVPEVKSSSPALLISTDARDEDKENDSQALSMQMPSLSPKDEEAALRSAQLLASVPKTSQLTTLGNLKGPPKPVKSSRNVSGQLQETSLNKVFSRFPSFRRDSATSTTSTSRTSRIDARAAFSQRRPFTQTGRTIRRALYRLAEDGRLSIVSPREEYMLCEDGIYLFLHIRLRGNSGMATDMYTWIGRRALYEHAYDLKVAQRAMTSEYKSAIQHTVRQGHESEAFLAAIGGILITRRTAARPTAPFMLCGRKHMGHIVFDEVECKPTSLCPAHVYAVWDPVANATDMVWLWRGSYSSAEEIGAARLVAMDLSTSGNVVEVNDADESIDFWKTFGDWPMREDALSCPEALRSKCLAADTFEYRLFKIEQEEVRAGFFTSMLSRRPSWGSRSSTSSDTDLYYEAREIAPFTQADLDAECVYVLDSFARIDVLIGPLSSAIKAEDSLHQHTMQFVEDYVDLCVEAGRPKPQCFVVQGGIPMHIPFIFRQWRHEHGLWGTAGLMAGFLQDKSDMQCMILQDALSTLQEKTLLQ